MHRRDDIAYSLLLIVGLVLVIALAALLLAVPLVIWEVLFGA